MNDAPYPPVDGTEPCAGVDVNTFFPSPGSAKGARDAKKICTGCHVIDACREFAIVHGLDGVYGGTTERERFAIRRHRGIRPRSLLTERQQRKRDVLRMLAAGVPRSEVAVTVGLSLGAVDAIRMRAAAKGECA